MSILILILKIAGCILLGILLLFLLVCGAAVFIPLRYKGNIEVMDSLDQAHIDFSATWFLHLLEIRFSYMNKQPLGDFRIFWKKVSSNDQKDEPTISPSPAQEKGNQASTLASSSPKERASSESSTKNGSNQKKSRRRMVGKEKHRRNNTAKKELKSIFSKIKECFTSENNQKAFKILLNELKYLCKHYGPRKLSADITFSLGDPAYTGIMVGFISVFPCVYHKGVHILPDFNSPDLYLKGTAAFKGRIRGIHIIKSLLALMLKKETRTVFLKIIKEVSS